MLEMNIALQEKISCVISSWEKIDQTYHSLSGLNKEECCLLNFGFGTELKSQTDNLKNLEKNHQLNSNLYSNEFSAWYLALEQNLIQDQDQDQDPL